MVKGGFQGLDITGVDLTAQSPTLPGAYATCAGADGKPIRVQTAYGQVECSVKKVSTNYVLAGVTGDGKILSITIGSADGIAVSETEIPSGGGGGEETDVVLQSATNLSTYPESTPFTAPNDGIINVYTTGQITKASGLKIKVPTGFIIALGFPTGIGAEYNTSLFIRKGTIVAAYGETTHASFNFYEYKPVES